MSPSTYPDESGNVTVKYHHEDGIWWGEVEGWRWSCTAPTLDECRDLAREGIPFGVDERLRAESILFVHIYETPMVKMTPDASEIFRLYVPEASR